ncbi:MAG: PilZ domain-containing protein [Treponema sp.]|jgi:hypothetical protein|nr:PilZ domain-containing protein [Treponema sp.]
MSVITNQKINSYYDRFKDIDVTYTKEILQVTGMITKQVHLKCTGDFWPCAVYSSSFTGAKVVVNHDAGLMDTLRQANNIVSLRFCFKGPGASSPMAFFVSARSIGFNLYNDAKDMFLCTLQFTQRPPDALIEIMGRILEANMNSLKRRYERIPITNETQRKLKLFSKESAIYIQGGPRRCILRDLSFSGVKLIMMGNAGSLVDQESVVRVDFDDPRQSCLLHGKIIRAENVEGRQELAALGFEFNESLVPMLYKLRINDYLSLVQADPHAAAYGEPDAVNVPAAEPAR